MVENNHGEKSNLAQWLDEFGHLVSLENVALRREELDTAISRAQAMAQGLADSHPQKPEWLHYFGILLLRRSQSNKNRDDATAGISNAKEGLALGGQNHSSRTRWLENLATMYLIQHEQTSEMEALELAISTAREALETAGNRSTANPSFNNLAVMYHYRYSKTEDIEDLDEAISFAEKAPSFVVEGSPESAGALSNLGALLSQRYEQTKSRECLESAIGYAQRAVDAATENEYDQSAGLTNLGRMLFYRYRETQSLQDLRDAISKVRAAIAKSSEGSSAWPVMIRNLLDMLTNLVARTGDAKEIQEILEEVSTMDRERIEELQSSIASVGRRLANSQAEKNGRRKYKRVKGVDASSIFVQEHDMSDGATALPHDGLESTPEFAVPPEDDLDEEEVEDHMYEEFDKSHFFQITTPFTANEDTEKDHLILVRPFDSPDSLSEIPRHSLKPPEGIQGRSLTLCGCCNELTKEEKQKTTLFWHNDNHLLWIPGIDALRSRPYPASSKPRISKRLDSQASQADDLGLDTLPLYIQADVSQYIQQVQNESSMAASANVSQRFSNPQESTTSPSETLTMSPLYTTYHEKDPSSVPFPPRPEMLAAGNTYERKPFDSIVYNSGSIIKRNHEHRLYPTIRRFRDGATLDEDYMPALNMSATEAEGRRSNTQLCNKCSKIDFTSFFKNEQPRRCWLLTPERRIRSRYDTCKFCRFLCSAVIQHKISLDMNESYVPVSLAPNPLLETMGDGEAESLLSSGWTACTIIPRTDCDVPCIQARLVAERYNSASPFMARLPARHVVDISLIRQWLWICENRHKGICDSLPWSTKAILPKSFKVIDVSTYSLVPAPSDCRYFALSYVRDSLSPSETALKTGPQPTEEGGLREQWQHIPQLIRDAIRLAKAMEIGYLWVDALCIPYEYERDLQDHIHHMGAIYSHAIATIISAGGSDSNIGLPGVWPHLRILNQVEEEIEDGIRVALPLDPARKVQGSVWNSMAWTLQEKLLSARTLTFIEDQVFWKCRCSTWFEDIISEAESTPEGFPAILREIKPEITYNDINEIVAVQQPRGLEPFPFPIEEYSKTGALYEAAISLENSMDPGEEAMCVNDPTTKKPVLRYTVHDTSMQQKFAAMLDFMSEQIPVTYTIGRHFHMELAKEKLIDELFSPDPSHRDVVECRRHDHASLLSYNFREYANVVGQYTRRQPVKDAEVASAFAGIEKVLESCLNAHFTHGLPTSHFDAALLWFPEEELERREEGNESSKGSGVNFEMHPSWSWMGWRGKIKYTLLARGPDHREIRVHPVVRWHTGDQHSNVFKLLNEFGIGMLTACQPAGKLIKAWQDDRWITDCLYTWRPPPSDFISAEKLSLPSDSKIDQFLRFQTSSAFLRVDETVIRLPDSEIYHEQEDDDESITEGVDDAVFVSSIRPTAPCRRVLDNDGKCVGYVSLNAELVGESPVEMIVIVITPGRGHPLGKYSGYAMMAIRRDECGVAYRIGLGEIDQDAWWKANPVWKQVILG